jgi:NADH:ubiquinone oxidoreductase subunit 6 (subunit J)
MDLDYAVGKYSTQQRTVPFSSLLLLTTFAVITAFSIALNAEIFAGFENWIFWVFLVTVGVLTITSFISAWIEAQNYRSSVLRTLVLLMDLTILVLVAIAVLVLYSQKQRMGP